MTGGYDNMLFSGATTAAIDDQVADTEARICALNVHNPAPQRAQKLVDWLLATGCNIIVLTELRRTDGGHRIIASMQADGFTVEWGPADPQQYSTALLTKGFRVRLVAEQPFDPRIVLANLTSAGGSLRLAAVYGPTNGMTPVSSTKREVFQRKLLSYLGRHHHPRLCVAGDLNVVDPNHEPRLASFENHDYAFYTGLLKLGLVDAYRTHHPTGVDHSWHSERYGSQRLDHLLISNALQPTLSDFRYDHEPRTRDLSDHAAAIGVLTLNKYHSAADTPADR